MRDRVEKVINAIRPVIQADEGDIALVDVDESTGVVTVELMGACVSCPASTQTLKAGIERIMKDRVEGVTEVVEVEARLGHDVGDADFLEFRVGHADYCGHVDARVLFEREFDLAWVHVVAPALVHLAHSADDLDVVVIASKCEVTGV